MGKKKEKFLSPKNRKGCRQGKVGQGQEDDDSLTFTGSGRICPMPCRRLFNIYSEVLGSVHKHRAYREIYGYKIQYNTLRYGMSYIEVNSCFLDPANSFSPFISGYSLAKD